MADREPPGADDAGRHRWQDRDTEPIPRARPTEPPPQPSPPPSTPDYTNPYAGPEQVFHDPPRFTDEEFSGLHGDPGPSVYSSGRVAPLDDEASKHVARYLFPTEKFRGEWKRHWIQLAKEFTIGGVATILMG